MLLSTYLVAGSLVCESHLARGVRAPWFVTTQPELFEVTAGRMGKATIEGERLSVELRRLKSREGAPQNRKC